MRVKKCLYNARFWISRIRIEDIPDFDIIWRYDFRWWEKRSYRIGYRWSSCPATAKIRVPWKGEDFLSLRRRKQSRIRSFSSRHRRKIQCIAIVFVFWGKARRTPSRYLGFYVLSQWGTYFSKYFSKWKSGIFWKSGDRNEFQLVIGKILEIKSVNSRNELTRKI